MTQRAELQEAKRKIAAAYLLGGVRNPLNEPVVAKEEPRQPQTLGQHVVVSAGGETIFVSNS